MEKRNASKRTRGKEEPRGERMSKRNEEEEQEKGKDVERESEMVVVVGSE